MACCVGFLTFPSMTSGDLDMLPALHCLSHQSIMALQKEGGTHGGVDAVSLASLRMGLQLLGHES